MDKKLLKSQKIVDSAMNTFTKAIIDIDKANELIKSSITADTQTLEAITNQIKQLENQFDVVSVAIIDKEKKLSENTQIKNKLEDFVGGTM